MADAQPRSGSQDDAAAVSSAEPGRTHHGAAESDAVVFYCSVCGSRLVAPDGYHGRALSCPYCFRDTPVPSQPLAPGESPHAASFFERERILSVWVRFLCPKCDSKLATDARAGGALGECPRCGGKVCAPRLPWLMPPGPASDEPGEVPVALGGKDTAAVLSADEICFLTANSHG